MSELYATAVPMHPGINHTDAKYVRLDFNNGSVDVTPSGHPGSAWPTLALQTAGTVSGGVLSIPAGTGGNRTTRIFANNYIDTIMDLSGLLTNPKYKCRYLATRVKRKVSSTAVTAAERIFQYGDQGSNPGETGGWVFRINFGGVAPFLTKSISMAVHTPYNNSVAKPGGQSDDTFPDPIYSTAVLADATWEAGVDILMGVDCSVDPWQITAYINGVYDGYDEQNPDLAYAFPPPGKSTVGPGNDSSSNGLVFFAQSTNQNTAVLKDADVWPIWIGEARDTAHLATIADALHNDPFTSPYSRI